MPGTFMPNCARAAGMPPSDGDCTSMWETLSSCTVTRYASLTETFLPVGGMLGIPGMGMGMLNEPVLVPLHTASTFA